MDEALFAAHGLQITVSTESFLDKTKEIASEGYNLTLPDKRLALKWKRFVPLHLRKLSKKITVKAKQG